MPAAEQALASYASQYAGTMSFTASAGGLHPDQRVMSSTSKASHPERLVRRASDSRPLSRGMHSYL
jgi:hypothetical protein